MVERESLTASRVTGRPTARRTRAGPTRLAAVDAWRGTAIMAMIAYHFAFDLRLFGFAQFDFERSAFWLGARALIVTNFLLLVGVSIALARLAGIGATRRVARITTIAACALAVSVASYAMFPARWIGFGVLHCIVVASLLAWPFAARPRLALAVGAAVVVAGLAWSHPAFDTRALDWIGFTTRKPATEDYVPLAPWAGVVFVGIAAGHAIGRRGAAPTTVGGGLARTLATLGRHSLAVYMIHQPVLIGALALVAGRLP